MLGLYIVIAVILVIAFFISINANKTKGAMGENIVTYWLIHGLDQNIYRVLRDVMIPDDIAGTTQIDHIVLSPFGIFVVETKNMKGWIFGNMQSKSWTQNIYRKKSSFQNPYHQNYKHIISLAELAGIPKERFISVIAFVGECQIKTRDQLPESLVTQRKELLKYIAGFTVAYFSSDEIDRIQERLLSGRIDNTRCNRKVHVTHVKNIIAHKNFSSQPFRVDAELHTEPQCPVCGSKMILRQARFGLNAGQHFWGCSRYPHCHGIVK